MSSEVSSFGAASGAIDRARVRLEGEHRVGAVDHLAVAEVHAVELADRDVAGAALGIGEPGDLHVARNPTTGLSSPSGRGSASAIRPSVVEQPHGAVRLAGHRHAVGRVAGRLALERHGGQEVERVASGTIRSGSASATSKWPIAVRRSSWQ